MSAHVIVRKQRVYAGQQTEAVTTQVQESRCMEARMQDHVVSTRKQSMNTSACTLLQAGIESVRRDVLEAKICFALAEQLFIDADDEWYASIARGWYDSTHSRSSQDGEAAAGSKHGPTCA